MDIFYLYRPKGYSYDNIVVKLSGRPFRKNKRNYLPCSVVDGQGRFYFREKIEVRESELRRIVGFTCIECQDVIRVYFVDKPNKGSLSYYEVEEIPYKTIYSINLKGVNTSIEYLEASKHLPQTYLEFLGSDSDYL